MNPEVLSAIIAGAISFIVSSLVAWWLQRQKLALDYDSTLRAERLKEYKKLWELTEPLGWYGNHAINPEDAKELLAKLDHWYFQDGGGLLMSEVTVMLFEKLLYKLKNYKSASDEIRMIGTKLRSSMAYDVGGRNLPLLAPRADERKLERKLHRA